MMYAIAYAQIQYILKEEKPFKSQRKLSDLLYAHMLDIYKLDGEQLFCSRQDIFLEDIREVVSNLAYEYDGPVKKYSKKGAQQSKK